MENANRECPYCHVDKNGKYTMYQFTNNQTQQKADISFYDGCLTVVIDTADADAHGIMLAHPIHYCPVCGRDFGNVEVEQ